MLAMVTVDTLADTVDSGDGLTSLREAIAATNLASEADTIEFAAALTSGGPATLTLTQGELKITDALAIIGPGADLLTINANDPTPDEKNGDGNRVFNVNDSGANQISVSISGLALTGGDVGPSDGGAIYSSENMTLTRVTIRGNSASGSTSADGGGIFTAGNLTVNSSLISNNSASGNGGGIRTSGGNLLVLVTDSMLSGNSAGMDGGGIFNSSSRVTVTNCELEGNSVSGSSSDGGGIFSSGGTLTVSGSIIRGNSANGASSTGGGISSISSTTIANSMIQNNMAQGGTSNDGGGIRSVGNLTIADSTINGNSALRDGGGILHSSGNLSVSRSTIANNSASRDGGAMRSSGSSLTMSDSTVSGNRANTGDGGGIWRSGSLTVTNSTLDGNIAFSSGGGLQLFGTSLSTFSIGHSTIAANSASSSSGFGGGAFVVGGDLILDHTILATNTARVGPDLTRLIDAVVNLRFSLIGTSANSGLVEAPVDSPDANGNLIGGPVKGTINPLLGPLSNYGGPTQTRFLKRGSPALEVGDPNALAGVSTVPSFDQRGAPSTRIFDGNTDGAARIDIGAYENRPLTFVVDTLADENDGNVSTGDLSLREAIALGNGSGNPEDDIIKFANALTTGGPATIVLRLGELAVTDSMRIIGPGAERLTIDANDPTPDQKNGDGSRVFNIDNGDASADKGVSLYGLTLTGGDVGGIGNGGAILTMEDLTVTKSTISGNATGGIATDNFVLAGGGIFSAGNLTVAASTISHNFASNRGGGIVALRGTLLITDSTISDNSTRSIGGGIDIEDAVTNFTMINSTVSGNSAHDGYFGGGGIISDRGPVTVIGSTITGNTAVRGGGVMVGQGVLTVGHTIIAGNTSNDVYYYFDYHGKLVSLGYNLIGTSNSFQSLNQPGDLTGVNPILGPLAHNGGPTMTHALLPGSPAIDAGDPSAVAEVGNVSEFDQRGSPFGRVIDGDATGGARIDIGAFEFMYNSDPPPVPWQNPAQAEDVNGDGMVSPVDVLIVINELLLNESHVLPASKSEGTPPYFLDVSGNGSVSPLDALIVINFLLRASNVASATPAQALAIDTDAGRWDVTMAGVVMASAAASTRQSETATPTIAASTPDLSGAIAEHENLMKKLAGERAGKSQK